MKAEREVGSPVCLMERVQVHGVLVLRRATQMDCPATTEGRVDVSSPVIPETQDPTTATTSQTRQDLVRVTSMLPSHRTVDHSDKGPIFPRQSSIQRLGQTIKTSLATTPTITMKKPLGKFPKASSSHLPDSRAGQSIRASKWTSTSVSPLQWNSTLGMKPIDRKPNFCRHQERMTVTQAVCNTAPLDPSPSADPPRSRAGLQPPLEAALLACRSPIVGWTVQHCAQGLVPLIGHGAATQIAS